MKRVAKRAIARAREWLDPVLRGAIRARTIGLAAEMSFWLFLSLVPLAAVAGLAAARLATSRALMAGSFLSTVPPEVRTMIEGQVETVAHWNGKVAPVALSVFVWLAANGVHAVFDALEVQSGTTRPWWKKRLLAMATCVGLSIGIAIVGLLAMGLDRVRALAGPAVPLAGAGASLANDLARLVTGSAVSVAMVVALYRVGIPREARHRTPILPGALLAVALLAGLGSGYRLYVSNMGVGDAYMGSLAVIGVTMMTLWLFSIAILLGAELNKVLRDRRTRSPREPRGAEPQSREAGRAALGRRGSKDKYSTV